MIGKRVDARRVQAGSGERKWYRALPVDRSSDDAPPK